MVIPPNFFPDFSDDGYWQEPDFLLSQLVSLMANMMNSGLGITLLLKGNVLTGTLIGEREYLAMVDASFKAIAKTSLLDPSEEDLQTLEETFSFADMAEDNYPALDGNIDEDQDETDLDTGDIRHLHLADPVIIFPGASISFSDSLLPIMRIRLTDISGWMLGRMAIMSDDDSQDFGLPHDNGVRH